MILPPDFVPDETVLVPNRVPGPGPAIIFYVTPNYEPKGMWPEARFLIMRWDAAMGHQAVGGHATFTDAHLFTLWVCLFRARLTRLDFHAWQNQHPIRARETGH